MCILSDRIKFFRHRVATDFIMQTSPRSYGLQQNPDLTTCQLWPKIDFAKLSKHGKYVLYSITNSNAGATMVVKSTVDPYEIEVHGADFQSAAFSENENT